jgi:hypothetical protein
MGAKPLNRQMGLARIRGAKHGLDPAIVGLMRAR